MKKQKYRCEDYYNQMIKIVKEEKIEVLRII
jgi:hypothetical protein